MQGNKRSLFYSWFFSYLLILMVPLMISGAIYASTGAVVERQIGKANDALLKQLQMEVDTRMGELHQVFQQFSVNPRVHSAATVAGGFQPKNMYNIYEIVRDLNRYQLFGMFFDDLFISYNHAGTVLNIYGHNDAQLFYNLFLESEDFTFADFQAMSRKTGKDALIKFAKKNGVETYAFAHPIAFLGVPEGAATIFVTVEAQKLVQTLDALKWHPENVVLIVDSDGQIICQSSGAAASLTLDYESLGEGNRRIDDHDMTVSVKSSGIKPWKYVVLTPTRVFYEDARRLQFYTTLGLLLCVLLCTLLAYHFAKRNFNPVKELVAALSRGGPKAMEDPNQFHWILHAVEELVQEKESASHKLYRNTLLLKKDLINKLLKDLYDKRTIDAEIAEVGLKLAGPYYAVVLFQTVALGEKLREVESSERLNLSGFVVVNCFENIASAEYMMESAELDAYAVTIVNLPSGDRHHLEALENAAYEAQFEAQKQFMVETAISIGSVCAGTDNLYVSYREAVEAMEYHALLGGEDVIVYDTIRNQKKKYYYPMEEEQRILNAIKAGNGETASSYIADVLAKNFVDTGLSPEMRRLLLSDMSSTIIKALDDEDEAGLLTDLERLQALVSRSGGVDFQQELLAIVENVCAYNRQKWEADSRADALSREVMAYVHAHYHDPNLSISVIGAAFRLTPGYISKLFKERTGEGLLAYINTVRVERAKDLLQAGAPLNIACFQVGYSNVGTLIRVFKKTYGITPGQVKKAI